MHIVGQEKLLQKLNSYTITTLPKTILLLGEEGCGKHTIAKYLAEKFAVELVDVVPDELFDYQHCTISKFYLISLNDFTEKQQNQFLKFIEEPPMTAHIILLANSEIGVLSTVLNRCTKFYFDLYTTDQLRSLDWISELKDELVYKICSTPGQVMSADTTRINDLYKLCTDLVNHIHELTYIRILGIVLKINCKEDYNKFDFTLFFRMLEYITYTNFCENNDDTALQIYMITNAYRQKLLGKSLNKEHFLLGYLTTLWDEVH